VLVQRVPAALEQQRVAHGQPRRRRTLVLALALDGEDHQVPPLVDIPG
jgi:hypothetical protein